MIPKITIITLNSNMKQSLIVAYKNTNSVKVNKNLNSSFIYTK